MQKVTEVQEQIENEKYPIAQETLLSLNQCHVLYFSGGLGEGGLHTEQLTCSLFQQTYLVGHCQVKSGHIFLIYGPA